MKFDSILLDTLTAQAKINPRLRQAYLSGEIWNQGIRNLGRILLGRWHNTECLESGTVILECKDGRHEALGEEDIL